MHLVFLHDEAGKHASVGHRPEIEEGVVLLVVLVVVRRRAASGAVETDAEVEDRGEHAGILQIGHRLAAGQLQSVVAERASHTIGQNGHAAFHEGGKRGGRRRSARRRRGRAGQRVDNEDRHDGGSGGERGIAGDGVGKGNFLLIPSAEIHPRTAVQIDLSGEKRGQRGNAVGGNGIDRDVEGAGPGVQIDVERVPTEGQPHLRIGGGRIGPEARIVGVRQSVEIGESGITVQRIGGGLQAAGQDERDDGKTAEKETGESRGHGHA